MKYTLLPPQESPRGLTAYAPPEDLLAHELGFYAVNNESAYKRKLRTAAKVKATAITPVVAPVVPIAPVPETVVEVIPTLFSLPAVLKNVYQRFEKIEITVTRPVNADFDGDAIGVLPLFDDEEAMPVTAFFRTQANRSVGEAELRAYRQY